jgi:hypothetical protein
MRKTKTFRPESDDYFRKTSFGSPRCSSYTLKAQERIARSTLAGLEDGMKRFGDLGIALALLFVGTTQVSAQESSAPQEARPLVLTEAIPLEGIKWRFDHFGTSGRELFISALGNNTVEVIDVSGRTLEHTIINRSTHAISRWALTPEHNFPMALDEVDHRLFVGTHEPARLAVYDTQSGHMIAALPSVQDAHDLYYDAGRKRIYTAGGEGFIYALEQKDPDQYQLLVKIPSALGARTAGYFGKGKKGFDRFYLAVPARAEHGAEVWTYTVQD